MKIVSMAPCGHYFCGECLKKWLNSHDDCPTCRKPMAKNDVIWINLELKNDASDATPGASTMTTKYGTKPAALVRFIRGALEDDADSRFIVFSQVKSQFSETVFRD